MPTNAPIGRAAVDSGDPKGSVADDDGDDDGDEESDETDEEDEDNDGGEDSESPASGGV